MRGIGNWGKKSHIPCLVFLHAPICMQEFVTGNIAPMTTTFAFSGALVSTSAGSKACTTSVFKFCKKQYGFRICLRVLAVQCTWIVNPYTWAWTLRRDNCHCPTWSSSAYGINSVIRLQPERLLKKFPGRLSYTLLVKSECLCFLCVSCLNDWKNRMCLMGKHTLHMWWLARFSRAHICFDFRTDGMEV